MKSNTHAATTGLPTPGDRRFFCSQKRADRLWSPPTFLFTGYRCSFPWVKQLGRDVNRSPSSGVEVNNAWNPTCPPVIPEDFAWHNIQPTSVLADPNCGQSHYRRLELLIYPSEIFATFCSFGSDSRLPFQTKFKIQNDVFPRRKRFKMWEMIFLQEAYSKFISCTLPVLLAHNFEL